MTTLIDRVADLLYPEDSVRTADIKFFCAGETPTTAEQIASRLHQALIAVGSGEAKAVEDFSGY